VEDAKKLEEEKKLSGIGAGKPSGTIVKKGIIKYILSVMLSLFIKHCY